MIRIINGSLTGLNDVEAITNAANGIGVMGAGIAGAIARSGGERVAKDARAVCLRLGPFTAGQCYRTESGLLKRRGIKWVYHAVTMDLPGGNTSLEIISKAVRSVLSECMKDGIGSIAMTAMGTGIGGLDKKMVANRMARIIENYSDQIDITIVDINKDFINCFEESLNTENFAKDNQEKNPGEIKRINERIKSSNIGIE